MFPKLSIILSKELLFQVPFYSLQRKNFFPIREFCKDRNKWKFEGAMFGEYGGWIGTSQTSSHSFCLVITHQRNVRSELSWWKRVSFLLINSGCSSHSAAFGWSNREECLLELTLWSSRWSHNRGLPSTPSIHTAHSLVWLVVVRFTCPQISSVHYCTVSFHHWSQFVLKTKRFLLHFSTELHVKKRSRRLFSLHLCGTQTSK